MKKQRKSAIGLGELNIKKAIFVAAVVWMWGAHVPVATGQSLADYLLVAAENNPALQASYARYTASLERVEQIGALPDPELSFGFYLQDMTSLMGDQKGNVSLMQRFPWFGRLKAGKDEASLMAMVNYHEFEMLKQELYFEVKSAYYRLYLLHHHKESASENLELLRSMERLALDRFKGGVPGSSGKMTDVLRIQSERKAVEIKISTYEDELATARVRFNLLLNRPEDVLIQLDHSFLEREWGLGQAAALDSIMSSNPQLKRLDAQAEAYRQKGEVSRLEGMPTFGVGLNYMISSERSPSGSVESPMGYIPGGMGHNMVMPMVSMSLPIFRGKYKASKREAESYREAARFEKEDFKNTLQTEVTSLFQQIRNTERNMQLYADQTELLRRTLDLMLTDYSTGTGSFEELLSVQRQLVEFEMKVAEEAVAKLQAIARLETLMAKGLEK